VRRYCFDKNSYCAGECYASSHKLSAAHRKLKKQNPLPVRGSLLMTCIWSCTLRLNFRILAGDTKIPEARSQTCDPGKTKTTLPGRILLPDFARHIAFAGSDIEFFNTSARNRRYDENFFSLWRSLSPNSSRTINRKSDSQIMIGLIWRFY